MKIIKPSNMRLLGITNKRPPVNTMGHRGGDERVFIESCHVRSGCVEPNMDLCIYGTKNVIRRAPWTWMKALYYIRSQVIKEWLSNFDIEAFHQQTTIQKVPQSLRITRNCFLSQLLIWYKSIMFQSFVSQVIRYVSCPLFEQRWNEVFALHSSLFIIVLSMACFEVAYLQTLSCRTFIRVMMNIIWGAAAHCLLLMFTSQPVSDVHGRDYSIQAFLRKVFLDMSLQMWCTIVYTVFFTGSSSIGAFIGSITKLNKADHLQPLTSIR